MPKAESPRAFKGIGGELFMLGDSTMDKKVHMSHPAQHHQTPKKDMIVNNGRNDAALRRWIESLGWACVMAD